MKVFKFEYKTYMRSLEKGDFFRFQDSTKIYLVTSISKTSITYKSTTNNRFFKRNFIQDIKDYKFIIVSV